MFNYIIMVGNGAITYLLAQKGTDGKKEKWYKAVIEYFLYVMLDMLIAYYCMTPLGRIIRVDDMTRGTTEIQYGNTAILFSVIVAVFMGLVFITVKKKIDIRADIERK